MLRRSQWLLILKLQRLIGIFSKINRSESFTTHSELTMLFMLIAAATDISIKLPSSTFCPQNLWARLYVILLHLSLPDAEEIFLLPSAPLTQSSSAAKARSSLDRCSTSRTLCQSRQKGLPPLIPEIMPAICVGHQAQLRHLPGSSFLPTHTLTGGFYFSPLGSIFSQSEAKMIVHSPELSSLHFQRGPGSQPQDFLER